MSHIVGNLPQSDEESRRRESCGPSKKKQDYVSVSEP
jgi:hypothetical protein